MTPGKFVIHIQEINNGKPGWQTLYNTRGEKRDWTNVEFNTLEEARKEVETLAFHPFHVTILQVIE